MKAIIPTGGRGTRMRPLTFSANKHFIPVANKPLIFYPIETVAATGIKDFGITYNTGGLDEVQSLLGDGSRWGINITYILQEKPLGLANIVEVCEEFVGGDSFVFHLGDNIFVDGIQDSFDYFIKNNPDGLVTMLHHPENKRMGVPFFDDNDRLLKYVEKPENPPHDFAIPGVYFANARFFDCFKGTYRLQASARGEFEIPDAFQWMIDHGLRVDVVEYKGTWLDPGKFDDWLEANKFMLENKLEEKMDSHPIDTQINGKVSIGKNCTVRGSTLNGPLIIGDNVTLDSATINPYAAISDNCVIKDSTIGNSVVLSGVKIDSVKRPIEGSLIGKDTEVVSDGDSSPIKLFIGELCKVEI